MLVNPISNSQKQIYFKGGPKPEIVRNQLKILLSQDIWAPKLSVKMPETDMEKEVLLEILENRAKLERFTRLKNQRFEIASNINLYGHLKQSGADDTSLTELLSKLKSYGNIETTLNTLDKNIELEAKKNRPALDYFKNIEKIEEEYLDKHLTKISKIEKFWHQVKKNNINKDLKYSAKELIDIIQKGNISDSVNTSKVLSSKPLSKKNFIAKLEKQYEQILRENVDIYNGAAVNPEKAQQVQSLLYTSNIDGFKRYPEVQSSLSKIFSNIRKKYMFKIDRIAGINIYPIGEIIKDMHVVENDIKNTLKEIKILKQELQASPNNTELKKALREAEQALEVHKKDWLMRLNYSMKYEQANRQKFEEIGREAEYSYLVDENIVLNKYKKAFKILEEKKDLTNDELEAAIN